MSKETENGPFTEWYDGDQKPVRDGVYERDMPYGIEYANFSMGKWRVSDPGAEEAAKIFAVSGIQSAPWRGLSEKPVPSEL